MPAIRTFSLGQFRKKPFYPCFVKPFHGSGGTASAKIHNEQELRGHIHTFGGGRLFVQDYVPGREYTIDVYRTRDGEVKTIVPRQRLIVRSGEVDNGVTIDNRKLIDATMKLVNLIDGLWGVFCCQCRLAKGDQPYFFEINPRFGGGATLSIAAGANLPLYLLQEVLGKPVTGEVGKFTPNLLLLRYSDDIVYKIKDPSKLPGFRAPLFK
jgi:carbamoyl-phosphate synthase large subunit